MSAAFRRLPRLVSSAIRVRTALSGLRAASKPSVAASLSKLTRNISDEGGTMPPFCF